jgi:manganese/zinc/iron transport system permease protein
MMIEFLQIDLPAILVGVLAALACGLLGNFLVLRRQSLMGDAISHVVLLGIVAGFLLTGTTATAAMLLGAAGAAILAVALIELVGRLGLLDRGTAMGVVFTSMFAAGVVLLEQSGARDVHIDVQHSLYGNIEGTVWLSAVGWGSLLDPVALADLPPVLPRLLVVTALVAAAILLFYKELKIATFDPLLADCLGIRSGWISAGLMIMVAVAAVAAFEAVGSILVIAMFVCPAATARMLTDRLSRQILVSAAVAVASGVVGYGLAAWAPLWIGLDGSLNAAGMMAVVAGLLQLAAMLWAPRHGTLRQPV